MDITALLTKLSQMHGISGHEAAIGAEVLEEFGRFAHATRVDRMGNVLAVQHGTRRARKAPQRKIMLASHMDEIGLMVAGIQHGLLRVSPIGGADPRVLLGQEVIVHGRRELPGIVASTPPHLLKPNDRDKVIPIDQLWIDVGLPPQQVRRLIQIGDLVTIQRSVVKLRNSLLAGKAFDNRASVAAVAACLEQLQNTQHPWDVIAVATVQEEENSAGATTAAFGVAPDVAIAVDVTYGAQYGSLDTETFPLGTGPTVGVGPNMHPKMTRGLLDAAKRLELETPLEPMTGHSGTDGWAIQVAQAGIPTGIVGIPLRSMHTPVETVSPKDIERTGRLLAEFISGLDEEFYQSLIDQS